MPVRTVFIASDGQEFKDLHVAEVYEHMTFDSVVPYIASYQRVALVEWLCKNYTMLKNQRNENDLSFAVSSSN